MTKDRLADFKRISQQYDGDEAVEMEPLPNEKQKLLDPFFEEIESIQSSISKFKEDIERIQKLHSFFLLRPAVDEDCKRDLDNLNGIIKASAVSIKKRLASLGESNEKLESEKPNSTELRMRETQYSFMQKWFVDLMSEHSISQSDYQTKYKERLKRELDIMGHTTTDEELDDMLESGNVHLFTEGLLMETEKQRSMLAEIETRHSQILDLEKSIVELRDLFFDMALLVDSQGDNIDNIEFNVRRARDATEGGRVQLNEARAKKQSALKKKICCYAILITICLIVIGAIASEVFSLW